MGNAAEEKYGAEENSAKEAPLKSSARASASFRDLYRYADARDFLLLVAGSVGVVISGANQPAQLLVFGRILDAFNGTDKSQVIDRIHFFSLLYALLGLQQLVTTALQVSCFEAVAARQAARARQRYFAALLRQPMEFFDTRDTGALASSVLEATSTWAKGIGEEFANLVQRLLSFVISLGVSIYLSWKFALVVAAGVPVIGAIVAVANRAYAKRSRLSENSLEQASSLATETVGAIRSVAALGQEPRMLERYHAAVSSACREGLQLGWAKAMLEGVVSPVMFVMFGLGLWWGSKLVADDMESIEACRFISDLGLPQDPDESACHTGGNIMTAFLGILFGFLGLIQVLPGFSCLAAARASAAKVFDIVDMVPHAIDSMAVAEVEPEKPPSGRVELVSISFAYPARPQALILKGLTLTAEAGQTVALVGPSGCGKSTVVGLLERFYDPSGGKVLLDGVDLRTLSVRWLRGQIGLVSQEPVLFNGTIGENIGLGRCQKASREEIEAAARLANAFDFVTQFPQGFETQVGDKGVQLSGGQKQRIAIARAVVRDPAILILDEATSALDTVSEKVVQAALDELLRSKRRTTFVIAHRLSTVRNADKIAVISEGVLAEEGDHDQLMSKEQSIYRALVEAQMQNDNVDAKEEGMQQGKALQEEATDREGALRDKATAAHTSSAGGAEEAGADKAKGTKATKEPSPSVGWIWKLMKPEKFHIVGGLLGSLVTGLTMPAIGFLMAEFIVVFFNPDVADMRLKALFWALVFLGVGLVVSVSAVVRQYCFAVISERLSMRVRELAFTSIIRQNIGWFDVSPDRTAGSLANQLSQDCFLVKALTGERVSLALAQIVVLVAGLVVAFTASWQLTLVVFAVVPAIAVPIIVQAKMVGRFADRATKSLVDAGSRASEAILNLRTVAAFGLESFTVREFSRELAFPQQQDIRKGIAAGFGSGAAASVVLLGASFQYFIGGIFFDHGIVAFGDIMRCVLVLIFMAFGMTSVSRGATDQAEARSAARRVHVVISAKSAIDPLEEVGTVPSSSPTGRVEFVNVAFAYPARPEVPVLQDLCLTAEAGQTVALVGPSGCGKSTIVGLLERFYDPTSGSILLDGVDVRTLSLRWLRAQIGLVSQEPVLFNGSIGENIGLGRESASQEEIEAAARLANAYDFVRDFPAGFGTMVGEKGIQLSGGQKQRVAIARAVVRDPAVLILDEATSALDTASERVVQAALDELLQAKRRTTFVIAHRLSTVQNADKIAVISAGRLVEEGRHAELLAVEGGVYRALAAHAGGGGGEPPEPRSSKITLA